MGDHRNAQAAANVPAHTARGAHSSPVPASLRPHSHHPPALVRLVRLLADLNAMDIHARPETAVNKPLVRQLSVNEGLAQALLQGQAGHRRRGG